MVEKIVLVATLLTFVSFWVPRVCHAKGNLQNVSADEFAAAVENAPQGSILDIRTEGEFLQGHIAGAVNIDYFGKDFRDRLAELPRDKVYYVYCRSGNRSAKALMIMKRMGFNNIIHLQSGVIDWVRSGFALQ